MHATPYVAGDVYGCYVPQSVLNRDGQAMDIDIVLHEVLHDGDEVFVEYSSGPQPYRIRCRTRLQPGPAEA